MCADAADAALQPWEEDAGGRMVRVKGLHEDVDDEALETVARRFGEVQAAKVLFDEETGNVHVCARTL